MGCKPVEYGRVITTYRTEQPNIRALRLLVKNFDDGMKAVGMNPYEHEEKATLVTTHNALYGTAAWYLKLHAEGCCSR